MSQLKIAVHSTLQVPPTYTSRISREAARRRTFAIISHPDAGKTTLTEKFLLYGGALHLAGSVTARKNQRAATSDWMALERERGISITSTVLQFEYRDRVINLLDTPGHRDFSEDTYRVLTAVDAAVMVIDAGKGIESQTRKLFEVCRKRGVPIFTFMNKLDRPARSPVELCDELESVLGIAACPMNWPLGDGADFRGVYDRLQKQVHLFERTPGGAYRAPVQVAGLEDPAVRNTLSESVYARATEELELLTGAGAEFDHRRVLSGELTPVFFGSAANNFGVQLLLDNFTELAPQPLPRRAQQRLVHPEEETFSGFVFKIQANMNPRHRDRMTFIRIVSGRFERDMTVTQASTGKKIRLSNAQKMFAQDRETLDEAWPGDVIGIVGNHDFTIGETLSPDGLLSFHEIPRFAPECFALLINNSTAKYKRFREGLDQLLKEGVAQLFELEQSHQKIPLIGAVGPLQFEVLHHRLTEEYGADCRIENAAWNTVRWLRHKHSANTATLPPLPSGATFARDPANRLVALFTSDWSARFFAEQNPEWICESQPLESNS